MLNISRSAAVLAVVVTMTIGTINWAGPVSAVPALVSGDEGDGSPPEVTPSAGKDGVWVTATQDGKSPSPSSAYTGPTRLELAKQRCLEEGTTAACMAGPAVVAEAGDPASTAHQVVAGMNLAVPAIRMVPPPTTVNPDSVGLVGWQSWMWVDNPEIFQTVTDTATLNGWTIAVSGRVESVDWDMGNGRVVRCTGPGTPYVPERDQLDPSPTCGHVYTEQGYYTVTATAHWRMDWSGGGQSGTVMMDSTSSVPVVIGEWQVLLKR